MVLDCRYYVLNTGRGRPGCCEIFHKRPGNGACETIHNRNDQGEIETYTQSRWPGKGACETIHKRRPVSDFRTCTIFGQRRTTPTRAHHSGVVLSYGNHHIAETSCHAKILHSGKSRSFGLDRRQQACILPALKHKQPRTTNGL